MTGGRAPRIRRVTDSSGPSARVRAFNVRGYRAAGRPATDSGPASIRRLGRLPPPSAEDFWGGEPVGIAEPSARATQSAPRRTES
jgi:hypothetical protein